MKRLLTLLSLLLVMAISARAAQAPVRITITTNNPSPSTARQLTIDVLSSSGGSLGLSYNKGTITTDESGVLSFTMNSGDLAVASPFTPWTNLTYDPNLIILVTYNGVVVGNERLGDVYAKQGLFGALVEPSEIVPGTVGQVLSSNGTTNSWVSTSNITELGTIASGTWNGTIVSPTYGGTGVNNGARTLTINTNSGTIAYTNAATTLTVANNASVSGTNTGDSREIADEFTPTASQTAFTLSQTPSTNSKVKMYINGVRISNTAYSWTGAALTYIPANNSGYALLVTDRVQFDFYY